MLNKISKQIGALMAQGKKEEGMALKEEVTRQAQLLSELEEKETKLSEQVTEIMMQIPQIIDEKVPIGKDDSQNVEIERFGEPVVPDYEMPYHTEIMEKLNGIDLDSARKVAGNGFYYLMGDIARLHSAVISYECTLIGRSRLAGRRVSVLRLNPIDEVRYGFMVAKDEDTSLPVELAITTPSKMVNARLTVSAVQATALDNLNFPDDTFDRSESLQPKANTEKATIWSELTIPKFFKLIDHGKIEQQKGVFADYQKFSDGLVEFMVYRNSKTDLMIQSASDGTLTVFRK